MTQVGNKILVVLVLLFASVGAFGQTDQPAKQPTLDARVRAEVSQFKGNSLFAKNLDTGAMVKTGHSADEAKVALAAAGGVIAQALKILADE